MLQTYYSKILLHHCFSYSHCLSRGRGRGWGRIRRKWKVRKQNRNMQTSDLWPTKYWSILWSDFSGCIFHPFLHVRWSLPGAALSLSPQSCRSCHGQLCPQTGASRRRWVLLKVAVRRIALEQNLNSMHRVTFQFKGNVCILFLDSTSVALHELLFKISQIPCLKQAVCPLSQLSSYWMPLINKIWTAVGCGFWA